jgi:NAD(P)-dependent dehydrogenase (short-subunit alcohol dehydrogenase family)
VVDFGGQVAIVTGAGRGLGRLYALDLARRGAAVVVNDVGGSMRGDGADANVANQLVAEIERAGGPAVASHHSVDSPEGGEAIVRTALDCLGRLDRTPAAEDIAAHLTDVASTERYTVPMSIVDEVLGLCGRLGINP